MLFSLILKRLHPFPLISHTLWHVLSQSDNIFHTFHKRNKELQVAAVDLQPKSKREQPHYIPRQIASLFKCFKASHLAECLRLMGVITYLTEPMIAGQVIAGN